MQVVVVEELVVVADVEMVVVEVLAIGEQQGNRRRNSHPTVARIRNGLGKMACV